MDDITDLLGMSFIFVVSKPKLYHNRIESISLITYLHNIRKRKHICTHVEKKTKRHADFHALSILELIIITIQCKYMVSHSLL